VPKAIAFIPHKQRIEQHRVDYLRVISDAMEYPFQAEDGRELAPIQQKLAQACATYSKLPYWSFTNCCTDSLQMAVQLLTNVGDRVIVPAYGWRAFSNAPTIMGREVDFCDIDTTGNVDLNELESMIKQEAPAAVIIVHNFGTIVDVSQIASTCERYGVKIIEDAAPSFYMGEPYTYKPGHSSDVVCYSFDFTKFPGCLGSGGGLATRDAELSDRIYELQAHGTDRNKQVVGIGTKSFMDNTSCAVLLKEFEIFEQNQYRERRRQNATWYINNLPYKSIPGENYIWERYSMFVPSKEVVDVLERLHSIKCLARTMFKQPLNTYSFYKSRKHLPKVLHFVDNLVHLPCHQHMTEEELIRIKEVLS
jgi:dTDP-4-amino-4,6-dideoxygalactose transaminase